MRGLLVGATGTLLLAGCATLPPVTMSYYPPSASSDVTVIQTVACDAAKMDFVIGYAVEVKTTYFRHPGAAAHEFELSRISSQWADAGGTFGFTDDGRLRSVNTSSTGQGEAIVKAGTSLATAVIGAAFADPCVPLDTYGKDGVVSLVYRAQIAHHETRGAATPPLALSTRDARIRELLGTMLPTPVLAIDAGDENVPPVALSSGESSSDLVELTLNHTVTRTITVTQPGSARPEWTTTIVTPTAATYTVPVPRAALFGTRKFAMTLSEAGRPISAGYEANSGAAGMMTAGTTLISALSDDSATVQAAETKAEADLIAQQQRLVRCRANPSACI